MKQNKGKDINKNGKNDEEETITEFLIDLLKMFKDEFFRFIRIRNAKALYFKQLKQLEYEEELENERYNAKQEDYQTGQLWQFIKPILVKYGLVTLSLIMIFFNIKISLVIWGYFFIKPILQYQFKMNSDYKQIIKYYRNRNFTEDQLYCSVPIILTKKDKSLNEFLSQGISGNRNAKAVFNLAIEDDKRYGTIRVISINDDFKRNKATSLEDYAISQFHIIPQKLANNGELFTNSYYSNKKIINQSLDTLLLDDLDTLVNRIKIDSDINRSFKEFNDMFKYEEEQEALRLEQEQKQQEEEEVADYIDRYDISDNLGRLIKEIKLNKEDYEFNVWNNGSEGLVDNEKNGQIKCTILNKKSFESIKKGLGTLKTATRIPNLEFKENSEDSGSFYIKAVFSTKIDTTSISIKERYRLASEGIVPLGFSDNGMVQLTSKALTKTPLFLLMVASSNSGKSNTILGIVTSLMNLKLEDEYLYEDIYINSFKPMDYTGSYGEEHGVNLTGDAEGMLKTLGKIQEINKQRVQILTDTGCDNTTTYNRKYPHKKLGNILLVLDEFKNVIRACSDKKIGQQIEDLLLSIGNTCRSQGIHIILIQQQAPRSELGMIRSIFNMRIIGNPNDESDIVSLDNTGKIAKYYEDLKNQSEGREIPLTLGKFFINAEIPLINKGNPFASGFSRIEDVEFDKETNKNYQKRMFNSLNQVETINEEADDYDNSLL